MLNVNSELPLIQPPAGKLITFFDINPILIATNPIPNKALHLLLTMTYFIEYFWFTKY